MTRGTNRIKGKILIVDDEDTMRFALADALTSSGYEVETAKDGEEAVRIFSKDSFSVVISDVRMPRMNGMDVLKHIKQISPETPVILITAYGTVKSAVEAIKEGAADYLTKPFNIEELEFTVKNVMAHQMTKKHSTGETSKGRFVKEIITEDPYMLKLLAMLKRVAKSNSSVLIQGESGTGKELIARYIYMHSTRWGKPFVAVNCAAIPHNLLESEMFGYEKGAFTGAIQRKIGKFELANGGTLLLDEVSEMDVQLQAKLLRVLQEGEIDRIGGTKPIPVDVRIIATTNTDLKAAIEARKFREDLYYRLNVIPVYIPPLRERRKDILLLANHFIKKFSSAMGKEHLTLTPEAQKKLHEYNWPGNIRELENTIERAVLICEGRLISVEHLGISEDRQPIVGSNDLEIDLGKSLTSRIENLTLRDMERIMILETLQKVGGNRTKAAQLLGISVRTMRNKIHEYNLKNI
ncbi:MAG: sigma-54 dependent transcriptional regulator [Syntrophales bacterium]|nr:sigma-54 dependent transcriptional regulator [Syntrophales bacterium]